MDVATFWTTGVRTEGGCLVWPRAKWGQGGYGVVTLDGRQQYVHRAAFALTHGDPGDLQVLHTCDNPPCYEPDHLFSGTQGDNVADMDAKGRANRVVLMGEAHGRVRLTDAQVEEIRVLVASGRTQQSVAQVYGVTQAHVSRLVLRKQRA